MSLQSTSWQTVGPYFSIGLTPLYRAEIADAGVEGERVQVRGVIRDGRGAPISDALIEVWQADTAGHYAHPEDARGSAADAAFNGFGRIPTDAQGRFAFSTIKPGRVPMPDGRLQAPHLVVGIMMRGLLRLVPTRMYFPDDPANTDDPVLALVPSERRATLIARRDGDHLRWDIHMQGPEEIVFFHY